MAVKVINKAKFKPKETEALIKEVEFLRLLDHKHIIAFHDFFDEGPAKAYLVYVE